MLTQVQAAAQSWSSTSQEPKNPVLRMHPYPEARPTVGPKIYQEQDEVQMALDV